MSSRANAGNVLFWKVLGDAGAIARGGVLYIPAPRAYRRGPARMGQADEGETVMFAQLMLPPWEGGLAPFAALRRMTGGRPLSI